MFRDTLHYNRRIMFDASESFDSGPPSHDQEIAELKNQYKVYNNRLQNVLIPVPEYNRLLAEGEALFGRSFRETAQELISKINHYRYCIDLHLEYKADLIYGSQRAPTREEYRKDVYPIVNREGGEGSDLFGDSIEAIIDKLNIMLVPLIRDKKSVATKN